MRLPPDKQTTYLRGAINGIDLVLNDLLPTGPRDHGPPPSWPWWQTCYQLIDAKLKITTALTDLEERTAT